MRRRFRALRRLRPGNGAATTPCPGRRRRGATLGVFSSGETCWWLPIHPDPARWLLVLVGAGHQQLNITTTEFLTEWLDGGLDLPVLSLPPVRRERILTRA
ncbi:hypothetical protein ACFQX6_55790 [Streptosporangium lutulentum]